MGITWPADTIITNVIIHTTNAVLLFLVFARMTGTLWRSAFLAAVFAWHPLHVESVAWVAERKDVLSGFFWILTLAAYHRYVRAPRPRNYLLVSDFFRLRADEQTDGGHLAVRSPADGLLASATRRIDQARRFPLGETRGRETAPAGLGADLQHRHHLRTAKFWRGQIRSRSPPAPSAIQHSPELRPLPDKSDMAGRSLRVLPPHAPPPTGPGRWGGSASPGHHRARSGCAAEGSSVVRRLALVPRNARAGDRVHPSRNPGHGRPLYVFAAGRALDRGGVGRSATRRRRAISATSPRSCGSNAARGLRRSDRAASRLLARQRQPVSTCLSRRFAKRRHTSDAFRRARRCPAP